MTPERLQELRDCHSLPARPGVPHRCKKCRQLWPCEQSQILDLALEAERLRGAAQDLVDEGCPICYHIPARLEAVLDSALAGTEATT